MTGRAKWDAWAAAGKKYDRAAEVEERYLEIARSLGWTESIEVQPQKETPSVNDDSIWDSDEAASNASSSRGAGSGMGVSVSSMAPPPDLNDDSIHGLVLSNDISGLTSLLKNHPDTDVNALDEFVSNMFSHPLGLALNIPFHVGICANSSGL